MPGEHQCRPLACFPPTVQGVGFAIQVARKLNTDPVLRQQLVDNEKVDSPAFESIICMLGPEIWPRMLKRKRKLVNEKTYCQAVDKLRL